LQSAWSEISELKISSGKTQSFGADFGLCLSNPHLLGKRPAGAAISGNYLGGNEICPKFDPSRWVRIVVMARFYFEVQTGTGVEHDTSGVDVADPIAALSECLDTIEEVIALDDFDELRGITIMDERHEVIATVNVEAIRRAVRAAGSG
jgi:hypothetical protein